MIQIAYINDGTLVKRWSDRRVKLLQIETGNKYQEAIDIVPCHFSYKETDEVIDYNENDNIVTETNVK